MARIRRVESEREKERVLDEFVTKGYKIKEQGQYSAKVKEKDWGDIYIYIFLGIFSLILGAVVTDAIDAEASGAWIFFILALVVYAGYSRVTAEEIIIKVEDKQS